MPSRDQRLVRLEAERERRRLECDPASRRRRAQEAVTNGTAALDEYAMIDEEDIASLRAWYYAAAPMFAACVRAGYFVDCVYPAVAYPPDEPLPEVTSGWFALLRRATHGDPKSARVRGRPWGPFAAYLEPDGRRSAACALLAMGANDGMTLRRQIWQRRGGRWIFAADVRKAAKFDGLTRQEVEDFFGKAGPIASDWVPDKRTFEANAFQDPDTDDPWIPFGSLARLISKRSTSATDAKAG